MGVNGYIITHLFDLVFCLLKRHLAAFLHGGKIQEGSVPVESVNEIGETSKGDTVVLAT